MKSLAHHIREKRDSLGVTQAELAALAGCSIPTVIAAEQGKPTQRMDKLVAILTALGLELTAQPMTRTLND